MRLTKYGHACVRIEKNGTALVIDPGLFTDQESVRGADALLITHEHWDHFAEERVRVALQADPALRVWTNRAVAEQLIGFGPRVAAVGDGDAFEVGGIGVSVHGEWHAPIHPDVPRVTNVGFLVDGTLFHPGDALTLPEQPVDTLMVPLAGPWTRTGDLVDYLREVRPARALGMHEAMLSEIGLKLVGENWLGANGPGTGTDYGYLAAGESLELTGE
ncbi:MBL fold metallo-hydrolase [Kitasatospora sp. NPDC058965]|uniref:MBL fold metallo-hydrolase n=1 Tax=Kitasatospora sp. NPDC058965 TaxID=3346682 RepID=UPI003689E306